MVRAGHGRATQDSLQGRCAPPVCIDVPSRARDTGSMRRSADRRSGTRAVVWSPERTGTALEGECPLSADISRRKGRGCPQLAALASQVHSRGSPRIATSPRSASARAVQGPSDSAAALGQSSFSGHAAQRGARAVQT